MSSNVKFNIVVRGFDSPETGRTVLGALQRLLDQEGLTDDIFIDLMGDLSNLRVEAYTPRPVVIARAHVWRPKFEQQIAAAMKDACSTAITQFEFESD
jgi:uncharacterized lipoprotein YmbA